MSTASDSEYLPHIEDANGNPVDFKVREDARLIQTGCAYFWRMKSEAGCHPAENHGDSVNLRKHNTAQIQFDTGDQPQIMQTWNLNLPVKLGASEFVVDSVTFLGMDMCSIYPPKIFQKASRLILAL